MDPALRPLIANSNVESDRLYLGIARRAHKQTERYRDRMRRDEGRLYPRERFAHAAVCIGLSAFAVEHAVKRLVHVRLYLQAHGERRERMLASLTKKRKGKRGSHPRTLRRLFVFVHLYSRVPGPLLRRTFAIFDHRNSLVHSDIKGSVRREGREEVHEVAFHMLDEDVMDAATECLEGRRADRARASRGDSGAGLGSVRGGPAEAAADVSRRRVIRAAEPGARRTRGAHASGSRSRGSVPITRMRGSGSRGGATGTRLRGSESNARASAMHRDPDGFYGLRRRSPEMRWFGARGVAR
jgi:hypothetical protein